MASPTRSYWQAGLAIAAGLAAIAACVFYPPAALAISPAVEFLVSSMPAFFGVYAGLAAFGTVVAAIGMASMGLALALSSGILALFSREEVKPTSSVTSTTSTMNDPAVGAKSPAVEPDQSRVNPSPIHSSTSSHSSAEELDSAPTVTA